jgi:uncharacterized protein (DUF1697 family)
MTLHIALLRGVNVGGNRKLPMAELRSALDASGARDVATYIQSGNVVLDIDGDAADARTLVADAAGRIVGDDVTAVALPARTLSSLRATLPAGWDEFDSSRVFLLLPLSAMSPTAAKDIAALDTTPDLVHVTDGAIWQYCPEGMGVSRWPAPRLEAPAGSALTARNLRTVDALIGMTGSAGG